MASRPLERALERRSERVAQARERARAEFRQEVKALALQPAVLSTVLLQSLVRLAYFGAMFGLASGVLFLAGQSTYLLDNQIRFEYLDEALYVGGQVVALLGTLIALNIARSAYRLYLAVRAELRTQ